jgi:GPI-anchor transamidase subunit GAA1
MIVLESVYRLNTYPFIHLNLLHALCNILALTPLMERYEAEHGTLMTVAMFMGRQCCLPCSWDSP